MEKEIDIFYPKNRQEWRAWLIADNDKKLSVWLIYYNKKSTMPTVIKSNVVDEALCFGWIDSKSKPLDEEKFIQFFSRRKIKSVWSKVNKEKVSLLFDLWLMTKAGFESMEIAIQNTSWTILDEAEALIIPTDLEHKFQKSPNAKAYFLGLYRSEKRNML